MALRSILLLLALVSATARPATAQEAQVAAPVIAASDGSTTCKPAQTVAISDATAGATIYYTLDGTQPTTSSSVYSGPITLTGTQTLIARAVEPGYQRSGTVAAVAGKLLACDDKITISVGGLSRSFLIHVPPSYAATRTQANPSPLLLDIHGYYAGSETPDEVVSWEVNYSGEKTVSNERGFILIYPEATEIEVQGTEYHSWAGVYCCQPALGSVDDVGFLEQVISWGETYGLVDTSRVYIMGYSNGSQMAHRMACDANASKMVTAVAAVSWPINEAADQCAPAHPMPMMEVHGTTDGTILYGGNTVPPASHTDPPITISAPAGAAVWRQINQCDTTTPVELPVTWQGITYDGSGAGGPDKITHIKSKNCANGVYTGLISVYNAGHDVFDDALNADKFSVAEFLWSTIFAKH